MLRSVLSFFQRQPAPIEQDDDPPSLPPAKVRYVLFRQQPGIYDILDGDLNVGSIEHIEVDPDRFTYWEVRLPGADYDYFTTLKRVKEWLGNPSVRSYR